MPECEVTSKTYMQLEVVPGAARTLGDMELNQKTHGFYMTALDAAMIAEHPLGAAQPMTLITEAENVKVTKKAGETWVAGDDIYWVDASAHFTNSAGTGNVPGALVGKAQRAAGNAAIIGFITMTDFYPHTGAVYPVVAKMPLLPVYGTTDVTTGRITLAEFSLRNTGIASTHSISTLRSEIISLTKLGAGASAIHAAAYLYAPAGQVTGMLSVINASLVMPAITPTGGAYYGLSSQIEIPNGADWATLANPVAFMAFVTAGAGKAKFDDKGHVFSISGVTPAAGKVIDNAGAPAAYEGSLRFLLNGAACYIPYSSTAGGA